MGSLLTHLNRKSDSIKQSDRLLVRTALLIRVSFPADSNKIHRRDSD